jgi:hypothetical protein
LAVVNCFALPRVSRKLLASLIWLLGPTPPGTRSTWLARNSSEPLRSAYEVPESLSREVRRTSVVGTRRTCRRSAHSTQLASVQATYVVLRGRALAGECTAEEGAQEGVQHGRHSIDINYTQGGRGGRGASVLATRTGRAGGRGLVGGGAVVERRDDAWHAGEGMRLRLRLRLRLEQMGPMTLMGGVISRSRGE